MALAASATVCLPTDARGFSEEVPSSRPGSNCQSKHEYMHDCLITSNAIPAALRALLPSLSRVGLSDDVPPNRGWLPPTIARGCE